MLQLETNPAVVQLSDLSVLRAGQHAGQWELFVGLVAARPVVQVAGWHYGRVVGPVGLAAGPVGLVVGRAVGLVARLLGMATELVGLAAGRVVV